MDFLGRDIALLAKNLRAHFEARLAGVGATLPAWGVLSCTIDEEGLSQRELAERMGIEAATLTRHLDRLEAEGLVCRRRDGHDRRILRVVPTTAARSLHAELTRVAEDVEAVLLDGLTAGEVAELRRLLSRLSINLEEPDSHGDRTPATARS